MFGKNYDKEIKDLYKCIEEQNKQIKQLFELIKTNNEWIKKNQENTLGLAEIQASHKKAIEVLVKR